MAEVVKLAGMFGWLVFHPYDARKSSPGYPDLTLVRERVIWAELKTDAGRLRFDQKRWIKALEQAGQDVRVWRPAMMQEIADTLGRRSAGKVA